MACELVNIGPDLRALAVELGRMLGAPLSMREVERAIEDSEADQVNSKDYVFLKSGRIEVSGHVDDYEHETIWITVRGNRKVEKDLAWIIELAEIDARRKEKSNDDV